MFNLLKLNSKLIGNHFVPPLPKRNLVKLVSNCKAHTFMYSMRGGIFEDQPGTMASKCTSTGIQNKCLFTCYSLAFPKLLINYSQAIR